MRLFNLASKAMIAFAVYALASCSTDTGNSTTNTANRGNANVTASPTTAAVPSVPPVSAPHPEARRISVEELQAALARNEVVVVDVRSEAAFQRGHIRGALLIPAGEIAARARELPRNKTIVTYCS